MVRVKAVAVRSAHEDVEEEEEEDARMEVQPERDIKSRRFHPGTVALREIKRYQKTTDRLIQRSPFQRLLKEVLHDINPELRMQNLATIALQEASEAFLTNLFEDSNLVAIHGKRTTVTDKDLKLVCRIRGEQKSLPPLASSNADNQA